MNPVQLEYEISRFADTDLAIEDLAAGPWATSVVAGLQFYSYGKPDEFLPGGFVVPEDGDRVTIMRRPDNPADGNACEVWWRNAYHLGHLPRFIAAAVAPRLDAGESLRAYVVDKGHGRVWELVLLLVGDAVADLDGQRRESFESDLEGYVEHLVAATWPTRAVTSWYGDDATVGRVDWDGNAYRWARTLRTVEPVLPVSLWKVADAARWESEIDARRARRRADATLALANLVDLYEPLPDGADAVPDPALRGRVFGWWSEVPPYLMTKTALRKHGLRPGRGIRPYARIEYQARGHWREYDLFAVNATAPLRTASAAALAAIVERQSLDECAVIL